MTEGEVVRLWWFELDSFGMTRVQLLEVSYV